MTRSVFWSSRARNDYVDIIRYIAERNPDAAEKVADRFGRTIEQIASRQIGRPGRVRGTYEKILTGLPYIIAFEVDSEQHAIAILRIIHSARDWPPEAWPD